MSDFDNATEAASLAVQFDQGGQTDKAVECYRTAARLLDRIRDRLPPDKQVELRSKVREYLERATMLQEQKAAQALDRAEEIKGIKKMGSLSINENNKPVSGKHSYTDEEKEVLRQTSHINNNCFLPFMDVDLSEKFQYALPFEDRASELKLSAKQAKEFDSWIRPHELCTDPKMIVGDHNKNKEPVYNPFGKYMVKLHLNGVRRKVIIDDRLPYSKYGRLLCSFSNNKNEFWNIDLHALTGWIPERSAIRPSEPDFNADSLFETLRTRLARGEVLASVATGELSEPDAERTGLVATHAYAVLDVRSVDNPWSHLRWRGNYSELDTVHWTQKLRTELHYSPD
ncbi:Uncharacterized protein OBRU01_20460, partial [Operophtera brumata]